MSLGTVLVANRGEIAVRVISTLRRLGIRSVAVYSDADVDALHVRLADVAVRLGPESPALSYRDIDRVLAAARATGADAIHPGYGFLSENAEFAEACAGAGLAFLGPSAHAIRVMGDKISAKAAVAARGVPTVPGLSRPGLTDADLIDGAAGVGFPVLVKPSAGGGGKGMRRVEDPAELPAALVSARREAAATFGDDTLFLERFVDTPRHIEVQIIADGFGTTVHLGERECSLQRRHQKVIEEAPSVLLDAVSRERIGAAACDAARSVGYVGVGTVEFIVSAHRPDEFFFMEMNTRLQVEHPVTELVTGFDLVELQVRVAAGEALPFGQEDVVLTGHAVEARVYAEDPGREFLPTAGTVLGLAEPAGMSGVRVDSGLRVGTVVGTAYDPMLSKVIGSGPDRTTALARLDAALAATRVLGLRTNIDFCRHLLRDPAVVAGELHTGLLDRVATAYSPPVAPDRALIAVAVARELAVSVSGAVSGSPTAWDRSPGWRIGAHAPRISRFSVGGAVRSVALTGPLTDAHGVVDGAEHRVVAIEENGELRLTVDDMQSVWTVRARGDIWWAAGPDGTFDLRMAPVLSTRRVAAGPVSAEIVSPMPGTVVAVHVADGDPVQAGDLVLTVEAMKMEHPLLAPVSGVVVLKVGPAAQVVVDEVLARVDAVPGPDGAAS